MAGRVVIGELAQAWRTRAAEMRAWGGDASARAIEHCASDLEAALRAASTATLTLEQAASESGYSVDHLSRLVRSGVIPNAGRKHAPAIRRDDLPRKAGTLPPRVAIAISKAQIAQSVADSFRGHDDDD
jgi:hypothetical protein